MSELPSPPRTNRPKMLLPTPIYFKTYATDNIPTEALTVNCREHINHEHNNSYHNVRAINGITTLSKPTKTRSPKHLNFYLKSANTNSKRCKFELKIIHRKQTA